MGNSIVNDLHLRRLAGLVLVVWFAFSVSTTEMLQAQVVAGLAGNSKPAPDFETIEMEISPSAEPIPAFKYRLSILPHETIVGNAATHYLRSFGERSLDSPLKAAEKKFGMEEFYSWVSDETPIEKLPLEKVREASALFDFYVKNHIDRASRCRECDWGLGEIDHKGEQVFGFLLPSVQQTRSISRVLRLQTRLAVLDKRYDDAIDLLRMNYQLGQDLAKINNLVCELVGVAHIGLANLSMMDLIGAEGAPNMYWALSELPSPIIELRDTLRLESQVGIRIFQQLKDVETAAHSEDEWNDMAKQASADFQLTIATMFTNRSDEHDPELAKFATTAFGLMAYRPAKQRLVDGGFTADEVNKMPVGQVLLIDAAREYQKYSSQMEKVLYLPFREARAHGERVEDGLGQERLNNPGQMLAGAMLPATMQVLAAKFRVQRDIEALKVIEAIRMHAAGTGKLPNSLDAIKVVPVPENPMSGEPFDYRLEGEKGVLELPKSDGVWRTKRYVLTLRK